MRLDIEKLVSIADDYWTRWSTESTLDKASVLEIVRKEIERAHNVDFLSEFKKLGGPDIYLNVNQNRSMFIQQLERSRPDQTDVIHRTLQKFL